jgi:hypothetical protein
MEASGDESTGIERWSVRGIRARDIKKKIERKGRREGNRQENGEKSPWERAEIGA